MCLRFIRLSCLTLDSLISIAYQIQEFSKSSREGFWPDKVRKNAGEQSAVQVFADLAFFCGDSIRVHRFFSVQLCVSASRRFTSTPV
jgi:hypothetical protein